MDNKKFEQLIDMIINENEEQARALFHDIVVEKSREIYESMMDEEPSMDQVGGLLDEIGAEEQGMTEEEDEFSDIEVSDDGEGEEVELSGDEFADGEAGEGDLEDRVVDLEDKLDELMAEFEEMMGGDEGDDMGGEEDFGGDEGDDMGGEEDFGDDEMMEGEETDEDDEEALEESVQLQNVKGLYGSKIGGDNGANAKSVALTKPKIVQTGANPVKFSGSGETVPTSAKAPSNAYTKGETQVKGAGTFKNAPGGKSVDPTAAPKPKHGDNGSNAKSIVGESRKTVKKIVK